jgi:hypothetical protein
LLQRAFDKSDYWGPMNVAAFRVDLLGALAHAILPTLAVGRVAKGRTAPPAREFPHRLRGRPAIGAASGDVLKCLLSRVGYPGPSTSPRSRVRVNKPVAVQYLGFQSTSIGRAYSLRVGGGEGARDFTVSIPHADFAAHRARYQDAPDICFSKLQRELALNADLPAAELVVSEAELLGYREAQTRRGERRPRAPKVPH